MTRAVCVIPPAPFQRSAHPTPPPPPPALPVAYKAPGSTPCMPYTCLHVHAYMHGSCTCTIFVDRKSCSSASVYNKKIKNKNLQSNGMASTLNPNLVPNHETSKATRGYSFNGHPGVPLALPCRPSHPPYPGCRHAGRRYEGSLCPRQAFVALPFAASCQRPAQAGTQSPCVRRRGIRGKETQRGRERETFFVLKPAQWILIGPRRGRVWVCVICTP